MVGKASEDSEPKSGDLLAIAMMILTEDKKHVFSARYFAAGAFFVHFWISMQFLHIRIPTILDSWSVRQ